MILNHKENSIFLWKFTEIILRASHGERSEPMYNVSAYMQRNIDNKIHKKYIVIVNNVVHK